MLDANVTSAAELLSNYIRRIISDLPNELQYLADEISEVVRCPDVGSWGLKGPGDGWSFLCDVGLPQSCPTMIDLSVDVRDLGECVQIGTNNYGDPVCIEKTSGVVVYFENEGGHKRHQINKSALAFFCSICAYDHRALMATRATIRALDPAAVSDGQWWHNATS